MEQARLILAITLSFLVIFVYNYFFVEPAPPGGPVAEQTTAQSPNGKISETPPSPATPIPAQIPAAPTSLSRAPRVIEVETPLLIARISEKGGALESLMLKDYRESPAPDSPLKQILHAKAECTTVLTQFSNGDPLLTSLTEYVASTDDAYFSVTTSERDLVFTHVSESGIEMEKRFRFLPDSYLIGLSVTIRNRSERPVTGQPIVTLVNVAPSKTSQYGFEGPSSLLNGHLEQIKADKIKDKNNYLGTVGWIAIEDRYFMSALIPANGADARMLLHMEENRTLENSYVGPKTDVPPGAEHRFDYQLFFGPKRLDLLKSFNNGLHRVVYFGWFDFIAKPCLWLMNQIHDIIPNYGIAIILLTILIKLLLWPLGNKSYKSMNEMKRIQPLMAEVREKYKGNKQKMNEEIMNLYRTYKVNPMGGCLPMVLQIPVFFALYRMLYEAIELRHAPFMGWINDLSAPDRLFNFGFSIPFMEPPYGIPVLTLVMGVTMFLQQKMSPPPGDPAQARIMMFMPVFFTFIFINFSSGLVLYWLVNNVLSISQQYYITRKAA